LDTDASNLAVGAESLQVQDGVELTIACGSHTLAPEKVLYHMEGITYNSYLSKPD